MHPLDTYLYPRGPICYADDIDLLSCRHKDMQETTYKLVERGGGIGLRANVTKTKEMRNNHATDAPITIQRNHTDTVQDFVYLGSLMTPDMDSETDIDARIQKATRVFGMLT